MRLFISAFFLIVNLTCFAQLPKLVIPKGHTNPVVALEADPLGKYLYSTDGGQEITVWDTSKKSIITFLEGHSGSITSLSVSGNGRFIASGDASGNLVVRNQSDWKISHMETLQSGIVQIAFASDSKTVGVLTRDGKLLSISVITGQTENTVQKSGTKITCFHWNESGVLALGLENGNIEAGGASVPTAGKPISALVAGATPSSWVAATGFGDLFVVTEGVLSQSMKTPLPRLISLKRFKDFYLVTGRGSSENFHMYTTALQEIAKGITVPDYIKNQEGAAVGLQTSTLSVNGKFLLLPDYSGGIHSYDLATGLLSDSFAGMASKLYSIDINEDGSQLAVGRGDGVLLFDLTGRIDPQQLKATSSPVIGLDFGTNQYMLAGVEKNGQLTAWDTKYNAVVYSRSTQEKITFPYLKVTPDDELIIKKVDEGTGIFQIKSGKKPKVIKLKESYDQRLTPDGKTLLVQDGDQGIVLYDTESFKKQSTTKIEGLQYFELSADGRWIAAIVKVPDLRIQLVDRNSGKMVKEIKVPANRSVTRLQFDPSGNYLITLSNVVAKGSSRGDFSITLWDLQKGEESFQLSGHSAAVSGLAFSSSGKVLFSSGFDGLIKCWSMEGKKEIATIVPLNDTEWAVITPEGLYDASRKATLAMHYSHGRESIALEQMKDKFYEPYLIPKLLGFHPEPIRQAPSLEGFNLYPDIKLEHPMYNDGRLGINLNDQGGGIGRLVVFINGKEVVNEARGIEMTTDGFANIEYGFDNHPYIRKGGLNKLTVRAYDKNGYLSSPEKSVYLIDEDKADEKVPTKVFGLVAGVSDYEGSDMDLKYAAKDAEDFYHAVKLSAESRFGKENVNIKLLATLPGQSFPTKANIVAALEEIKDIATHNDYLVVYLSGHGITQSGEEEDFYYLTADASSSKVRNENSKASYALSSIEIGKLVMQVPTIRQVLVIDACHSGQLAQNLTGSSFSMSSEQVRALESLKDRTGLYIIAGSAADAVSYEASAFDQGLLTYSLLYGMKGPALRDERYIDIIDLFNFASKKVPELASEIGGVQKPEVRVPNDLNSFDIGELSAEGRSQIMLKASRPAVASSAFQNEATFSDDLQIGELIDQRLKKLESENTQQGVMFVDAKTFPEAYVVRGRYSEEGETIIAKGAIFQGKNKLTDLEVAAPDASTLADAILEKMKELIK